MMVDNIDLTSGSIGSSPAASAAPPPFFQRLQAEVDATNDKLVTAETNLRDLATGKEGNIHHVMLSLEDARLSLQLLTQVRNKVLEAYQDLLRMQI